MKAVVLERQGVISVKEVPDPPHPGPGELRIAPHTVGICGSDAHYYTHGRIGDFVVKAPMILGHEAAGTVVEVGEGVEGFQVGDRVAMEPGIPDMQSRASKEGMYNVDPSVRFFATPPVDGCLCDVVNHPAAFTYHLPDNVSFAEGALLEPLAVAVHSAVKAKLKPGDIAVVIGSGTVGILTACAALAGGAAKVIISDVSDVKLGIAAQTEGVVPVNVTREDLATAVNEHTHGYGADVVFEASGAAAAYRNLLKLPAPGGCVVLIGMPVDPVSFDVVKAQSREVRVETIFRYANVYQRGIEMVASGKVDLKRFVTATYGVDEAQAAFDRVVEARPEDVKIQILM